MLLMLSFVLLVSADLAHAYIDINLQMQLGNPSGATADTNNHNHFLIQRTVEALDYNDTLGEPNWASWDLTAGDIGTNSRSTFVTDTNLPPNFTRYSTSIYNNAGWDRGHLCPSKDRTDTSTNNDLVFFMSNVLPQSGVNNSGVWLQFENYCRDLVQSTNNYELLLICGGSGYGTARLTNGPFIPDYVWKIAVVVPPGSGMATNRITGTNRVIAIKIPNNDSATNTWPTYVTSANQIQVDTGLTFFTALAPSVAAALRAKVDGQTNPPPSILAFTPSSGVVGTNVIITGTNFSSVVAVTFGGANASFTVNANNQITATVPTNAGSGLISVTTASGTAISTNSFTVIGSGGGTVFNGVLAGWDVKGLTNYGPSPYPATTTAANLGVVGLTRSANMRTNNAGAQDGWGGVAFTNQSAASAIASNVFVTFSLTASNGYKVSYTSINRFDYRRSNTGPTNSLLQFSVGNSAFVDVMTFSNSSAANGATNAPIDLTSYASLQNVGANTNVTFRIVNYNGASTGVWYIWDVAGNTQPDLSVSGTVTQVLTTNAPAIAPTLSSFTFISNQFQFTVTGTAGSNYVVQATTNLTSPNWIPVFTNTAPFVFTQLNTPAFSQRFYRSFAQ
jgi:DNA/RNA endonuclease G (NUC1)